MVELPFKEAQFDAVVFGDVLEHMLDPWSVIRKLSPYIKVGGDIFASIPNVGHITIIEQLLNGTWTYTEAGLLDKTHFRFFYKKTRLINYLRKMVLTFLRSVSL